MSGSDDCSIIIWNTREWYSDLHEGSKIRTITPHKILKDGHSESIQDLSVLPNGIVLSCAYDNLVIAWSYLMEEEIKRYERNEQMRCMDYIDSRKSQKLYVGTNKGVILTIDIQELLEMDNLADDFSITKKMDMEDDEKFMGI